MLHFTALSDMHLLILSHQIWAKSSNFMTNGYSIVLGERELGDPQGI